MDAQWQLSGQGSSPLLGVGAALVTAETSPAGGGWGTGVSGHEKEQSCFQDWTPSGTQSCLTSKEAALQHVSRNCHFYPPLALLQEKDHRTQPGAGVNWEREDLSRFESDGRFCLGCWAVWDRGRDQGGSDPRRQLLPAQQQREPAGHPGRRRQRFSGSDVERKRGKNQWQSSEGGLRLKHIPSFFPLIFKQEKQLGDAEGSSAWCHERCWTKLKSWFPFLALQRGCVMALEVSNSVGSAVQPAPRHLWAAPCCFPGQHLANRRGELILAEPSYPGRSVLLQKDTACPLCKPDQLPSWIILLGWKQRHSISKGSA